MGIVTVGIDLAKNVFALHGVDQSGKAVFIKPKVVRGQLLEMVAQLPPCLIGMEACSGAHHWAREFSRFGHTVKLMAPKFVAPYRMSGKRGKNDAADAAAICEAVTRPNMRFVPVKDVDQQAILCLHRTRQGFIEERTALYNRLRGLISEFGIVLPQKVERLRREIGAHLEELPGWANRCVGDLLVHADRLNERIEEYDQAIAEAARQDAAQPATDATSRHWPDDGQCAGRQPGRWSRFQEWSPTRRLGSAWCPASTAAAAKRGWAGSPRPAMPTCAACWSWAPEPFSPVSARSKTASVAGHEVWSNDAATGKPRSPSPPRTCAWRGRCCTTATISD